MKAILFVAITCFAYAALAQSSYQFGLYTISMGYPSNVLNIYGGFANGTFNYVSSVNTTGSGIPTTDGGLQSQFPVVVVSDYAASVNPSSNSVSFFYISPSSNPTSVTLIQTLDTAGDWPNSVAINNAANVGCVVNTGTRSTVTCYALTYTGVSVLGTVSLSGFGSLTTPPVSHTGPSQISFTPSGTAVIVAIKNGTEPLAYIPLSSSGAPQQSGIVYAPAQGEVPFAFAFNGNNALVLVDAAPYGAGAGVITASFASTGLSYQQPEYTNITGQVASCWVVYSPSTSTFFATNTGSTSITAITLSSGNPVIGASTTVANAVGITDTVIATVGSTDYLFVLATHDQTIHMYLVGSAGSLTYINTISTANSPRGAGVAVYVNPSYVATSTSSSSTTASTSSTSTATTLSSATVAAASTTHNSASHLSIAAFVVFAAVAACL